MNWYHTGSARVYCGVHESVVGTKRTWRDVRHESAFGGKAENIYSERVFRLLTQAVWKRFSSPKNCKQPGAMDLDATV